MIGEACLWLALTSGTAAAGPDPLPAPPPLTPPAADFDQRAFMHGRRTSVAGLFLGWAGPGLVLSGGVLALTRDPEGPLTGQQLVRATTLVGGGLTLVGLGLQLGGSRGQSRVLAHVGAPTQRGWRRAGVGFGAAGIVLTGLVVWRTAEPGPDGRWLAIGAPAAGVSVLAATAAHTVALLQADAEAEAIAPALRLTVAPSRDGVTVGISGAW